MKKIALAFASRTSEMHWPKESALQVLASLVHLTGTSEVEAPPALPIMKFYYPRKGLPEVHPLLAFTSKKHHDSHHPTHTNAIDVGVGKGAGGVNNNKGDTGVFLTGKKINLQTDGSDKADHYEDGEWVDEQGGGGMKVVGKNGTRGLTYTIDKGLWQEYGVGVIKETGKVKGKKKVKNNQAYFCELFAIKKSTHFVFEWNRGNLDVEVWTDCREALDLCRYLEKYQDLLKLPVDSHARKEGIEALDAYMKTKAKFEQAFYHEMKGKIREGSTVKFAYKPKEIIRDAHDLSLIARICQPTVDIFLKNREMIEKTMLARDKVGYKYLKVHIADTPKWNPDISLLRGKK